MKIMVVGKGGREHALCWKLAQSPKVKQILCVPGNAGIEKEPKTIVQGVQNLNNNEIINAAYRFNPDLTIIGPEAPLVDGITDDLHYRGYPVFGPSKAAAQLEGRKSFCKRLLVRNQIPTASAEIFTEYQDAVKYLEKTPPPYVIKADGLASGKGVTVTYNLEEARQAVEDLMARKIFGKAGETILIEEYLEGEECSIMALTDGYCIQTVLPSQDHKRLLDFDRGPNTGGMGAYAPYPRLTRDDLKEIESEILRPTLLALRRENIIYRGVLYAGLMLTADGPKVLEYNVRFGDPEIIPVLMLLKTDLLDLMQACTNMTLSIFNGRIEWHHGYSVCVEMASPEYPDPPAMERPITMPDDLAMDFARNQGGKIFHAGTKWSDGMLVTNGGRVLAPAAAAYTLPKAIKKTYEIVQQINWEGCHYRTDIGQKGLNKE